MKYVVATNSQHKLKEIKEILGSKIEIVSLSDLNLSIEVEETGKTFLENSLIKARAVCALSGLPTLADDTGLMVDALNGEPGIYTARYAGIEHNDKANREKLLENLKNVEYQNRTASFRTVISIVYPDGKFITEEGEVSGHILTEEVGDGGFGYDSVFFSDELGKSFAEASDEEKNSVSHRGRALRKIFNNL